MESQPSGNFTPLNSHVEVMPIEVGGIIKSKDTTYEEKGVVLTIAAEVTKVKVGWTVYFDSWLVSKYTSNNGEVKWLVPEENIRAYEESLPE